jgi:hypothetical protein
MDTPLDASDTPDASELVEMIVAIARTSRPVVLAPDKEGIRFEGADGRAGVVLRGSGRVFLDAEGGRGGPRAYVGALCSEFPINANLGFLHRCIDPTRRTYDCQMTDRTTVITAQGTIITLYDGSCARVCVMGKKEEHISKVKTINLLNNVINTSVDSAMRRALGRDACRILQGNVTFVNNGTSVVKLPLDPAATCYTDEDLMHAVVAANPSLMERIRTPADVKSTVVSGMYFCDPKTNIWTKKSNTFFETMLVDMFAKLDLSVQDRRHVDSRRGRGHILYCLASRVEDTTLEARLDSNRSLFAVRNGVFDMATRTFRPIRLEDWVNNNSGWSYDAKLAARHRPEVDEFLAQVLPLPQERAVALAYFASLLSGNRKIRKFLVFTDRRSGANGKSAFCDLMRTFFGTYSKCSSKFVCKGSFDEGKNSHGSAAEKCRGKRLVISEELSRHMKLDGAMLKKLTGGASARVEDRKFNKGDDYEFVWQAGFVLVFNERCCPKFDTDDEALIERMIVIPFRSKFVVRGVDYGEVEDEEDDDQDDEEVEAYTYRMDHDMTDKFPLWMSALCDVLLEAYGNVDLLTGARVAPSILQWKAKVVQDVEAPVDRREPVSEWAQGVIEVTGDPSDFLLLANLKAMYQASNKDVEMRGFSKLLKESMKSCGVVTREEVIRVSINGGPKVPKRNVFFGARLGSPEYILGRSRFVDHRWASQDTSSKSERAFREALEASSGITFEHNVRPEWLKNPLTSHLMELDLYCKALKLAIEYDGPQHYEMDNMYHKTKEEFLAQQARDAAKDEICLQRGVRLIRVRCNKAGTAEEVRWCLEQIAA